LLCFNEFQEQLIGKKKSHSPTKIRKNFFFETHIKFVFFKEQSNKNQELFVCCVCLQLRVRGETGEKRDETKSTSEIKKYRKNGTVILNRPYYNPVNFSAKFSPHL